MQAIITKVLAPTNSNGARVKATSSSGSITIPYPGFTDDSEACHRKAAEELCSKLDWHGSMVCGGLPDGAGYAFVFVE
jgi:hypothetical protein